MQQKSIKENFIFNMLYQVLSLITPFITAPYIARVIGVEGIGAYSYTQAIVVYFALLAGLGSGTHGQRGVAGTRNKPEEMTIFFFEVVILRLITVIFSSVLYIAFISTQYNEYKTLFALQIIDIVACAFDISWFYQGLEDFKKTVTRQILIKIGGIILIICLVKKPDDLALYVLCHSIPTLLGNLFLWPGVRKNLVKIDFKNVHPAKHIKPEIELFIPYIGMLLFSYVDKAMLGAISGSLESGFYEQALKFITMGISILSALSMVLLPRMAYLYGESNMIQFIGYIKKGIQLISLLGCLISMVLFAVGGNFIPWFYGEGYERSILLLEVLSLIIVFKGINNFVGSAVLIPSFKQNQYAVRIWITTIVNVVLNGIMIPVYGALGAVCTSVFSEIVMFTLSVIFLKKYIDIGQIIKLTWKYVLSGCLVGACVFKIEIYLEPTVFHTIMLALLCIGGYVCSLIIVRDNFVISAIKSCFERLKKE